MRRITNILFICHSHPKLSKGGAEVAAYKMFKAFEAAGSCKATFIGFDQGGQCARLGVKISQPFGENEYVYSGTDFDWYNFANRDIGFYEEFRSLLKKIKPDIVHFHHYANFGVEAIYQVKKTLPSARIVMTLHEYLAICNHYGQMITKTNRSLCNESTWLKCAKCFPEREPSDFFLRETYIKRFFKLVDLFIAPSQFLRDRYVSWGISPDTIVMRENIVSDRAPVTAGSRMFSGTNLRVAFFGQISVLKGINVLFDAASELVRRGVDNVVFEIHGDYRGQPKEFQDEFEERLKMIPKNVKVCGSYDSNDVDRLMSSVDVVVVPSIWWENSPVVIQEALRNRVPVICSNIGGMAEKIRDGVDGFHFEVSDYRGLADVIAWLADDKSQLDNVRKSMKAPRSEKEMLEDFAALYGALVAAQ